MNKQYINSKNISDFDSFCDSVIDSVQQKIYDSIGRTTMTINEAICLKAKGYKFEIKSILFSLLGQEQNKYELYRYLEKFRGQYYQCSDEQELLKLKEVAIKDLWRDTVDNYLSYCFWG